MNDPHTDDPITRALSPEGVERRDAMLASLMADMRRVHARRRARRLTVFAAAPALLMAIALFAALRMLTPAPTPLTTGRVDGAADAPTVPATSERPAATIEFVRTSDGNQQSGAASIILIDDDQLLDTLASINRPTGLVRAGGRVWLTSAVADDAPRTDRSL
jgi:hypothetical protein